MNDTIFLMNSPGIGFIRNICALMGKLPAHNIDLELKYCISNGTSLAMAILLAGLITRQNLHHITSYQLGLYYEICSYTFGIYQSRPSTPRVEDLSQYCVINIKY